AMTGVKGVINDAKFHEEQEKNRSLIQQRAQLEKFQKNALQSGWLERQLEAEKNWNTKDEGDEDIDDLIRDLEDEEDAFVKEYKAKRLMEMAVIASLPKYGTLKEIEVDEYVSCVENVDRNVVVLVHLYQPQVEACRLVNRFLEALAAQYPLVKMVKIISTKANASFDNIALPALLIYKGGELQKTLLRITDEIQGWARTGRCDLDDFEEYLIRNNVVSLKLPSNIDWNFITAAAIGAASAIAVLSVSQALSKKSQVRKLKDEFRGLSHFPPLEPPKPKEVKSSDVPEELIREQLSRNYSFLGEEGMKSVRSSFVIIVGLGGVGSHAAHMLVRSGVQKIRIIDFDQVSLSSLNRHAVAIHADVGTSKAACLVKHFKEIAPQAEVEAMVELFNIDVADRLLSGNPDYVLDCIDNLNTKIDLIKYCHDHKLPIISSMGAGAKADPSRIQIADVSDTSEDPLARAT
ncbi:hypothetical protein HDU99_005984, partial [Rhizoclosmatium hyalinum]